MNGLWAIFSKDWKVEFRTGAHFFPLITLTLVLTSFLGLGVTSFISDDRMLGFLFHPLVWAIFLLSGAFTITRLFEDDKNASTLRALALYDVPLFSYFLAKGLFISLILFVNHLIATFLISAFLDVTISRWIGEYLILSLVVSAGYAALGSFLSGLAVQHSNRYILFPLVFLPLLFPLFFAVLEVSIAISIGNGLLGAGGWFSLLIALATGYAALGTLLFDVVAKE